MLEDSCPHGHLWPVSGPLQIWTGPSDSDAVSLGVWIQFCAGREVQWGPWACTPVCITDLG